MTDIDEILLGMNPLDPADGLSDLDGDGLSLAWEFAIGTNPDVADTDMDDWSDSEEYLLYGTDPLSSLSFPRGETADGGENTDPISPLSVIPAPEVVLATPIPPSLSNGDFSVVPFTTWKSMKTSTEYQGKGFEWAAGKITGWAAYVGSTVEVWNAADGEKFVELDGSPGNYGITQEIANPKAGGYILAWKQSGRYSTRAGTDPYSVQVYYMNGATKVPISQSIEFADFSKMQWSDNSFGFQITPKQLTDANNVIYVAFIPTESSLNTYGTLIDKVRLLPVEIKVTDFATKSDTVPYVAMTNASPPKNSELCLKADKVNETAKIEIELPSITDATLLSKMRWKVIQKPADTTVREGLFGGATPPNVELSLGSGALVEDEIMFEVQVGVDDGTFKATSKLNVRVVRDRLNWWFEPFTTDNGWRTAKPESRADTGDYKRKQITNAAGKLEWVPDPSHPDHHPNAYKRESLQSVYEFFKSTTAIGPSTPKANWVKPSITCFGQFHDALKAANGNNPLVDLNSLARINLTAVTELPSFNTKFSALRSVQARQTTFKSDPHPTYKATKFPARVEWATAAAAAIADPRMTRGLLMEIWTKEGSMSVNVEDRANNSNILTGYSVWPIRTSAVTAGPPATADDAKTIYAYEVAYICMGSDFLLKKVGGEANDNQNDLRDYPAARAHYISVADSYAGPGMGNKIYDGLTATPIAGVAATGIATLKEGGITAISVTNGSTCYAVEPAVTIGPAPIGGVTATATATITKGIVTGFTITNPGTGYTSVPPVTVSSPISFTITADATYYRDVLTVVGKFFLSIWQPEGPDVTYMKYNQTVKGWDAIKASISNTSYPERARLGLVDWAIHYEIRPGEFDTVRSNAQVVHCGRVAFEAKYP